MVTLHSKPPQPSAFSHHPSAGPDRNTMAQQRSYIDALFDRIAGWHFALGPERSSYTTQELQIPLEDDGASDRIIHLAATLWLATTPAGTILVQTPYGRRAPFSFKLARVWAARGYNVLLVSSRGTFGSGGAEDPAQHERGDGLRVVRWMRRQVWYTGSFATWGMSYLGYAQWALMASDEDELSDMATAVSMEGPHDFAALLWGTGALWLNCIDWAMAMQNQERLSWWRALWELVGLKPETNNAVKMRLPLDDGVRGFMGPGSGQYKWLHEWLANEDIEGDPRGVWKNKKQGKGLERKGIPVLLLGGWQDVFIKDSCYQYERLKANGCTVGLTVGPYIHGEVGSTDGTGKEILDWFDRYLAKEGQGDKPVRKADVRINITGSNEWRWLPSWPPASRPLELFLESQSRLSRKRPAKTDVAQFTFDPHHPTPTMGGPLLFGGGYVNDAALATRHDVLSFDLPLDHDVEVMGTPRIELLHSSDNPHVDIFARLSEVNSKGASRNLCEVYKRLDPTRAHQPGQSVKVVLDLSPVAHRFKKGTSIRLLVAGGCFPQFSYNLGSGEPTATGTTLRPARHTVHIGEGGSRLVLPVSSA